jgi:beta-galactosidase
VRPDVAIIYDWENGWAMNDAQGPRRGDKGYLEACKRHYRAFWDRGVPVDIIDMDQDFSRYKLLVAPMLYMVRPGVDERIAAFVQAGGTLVTSYLSGIVDENDLVFLGGWPGAKLREVVGVWAEEIDALYPGEANGLVPDPDNILALTGEYTVHDYCDLVHVEDAEVLATYARDFYAGRPGLTVNHYGEGEAYYLATTGDDRFLSDLYGALCADLDVLRSLRAELPGGVSAQLRSDGERAFIFVMNFNAQPTPLNLGSATYTDLLTGDVLTGVIELSTYDVRVLAE